jgi:hypothetical protein
MGERISITGNTVVDCGDVGIDFEGCFDSTAAGNTVADCKSSCLCTVFDNRGIVFSGNSCAQHTPGWAVASVMNQHHSAGNHDVNFTGNSFANHNGISAVVSQGVQHLLFNDNILRNVGALFYDPSLNHSAQTVSGNDLYFDTAALSPFSALRVGPVNNGGQVLVQGNNIVSRVPQPNGSAGINAMASSATAERYLIANNIVSGWAAQDVFIESNNVPTSNRRHFFSLHGNLIDACSFHHAASDSASILLDGNYDSRGDAIKLRAVSK